jgi:lysophospholipase
MQRPRQRSLPPGGTTTMLAMADGWPVRAMHWPGRRQTGVLLVTGRGDFAEKYAETLWDLVDAGWPVAVFDWRGQGLSGRVGITPAHGDTPGFDLWAADLAQVIGWAGTVLPGPLNVMAHSMGGHFVLRHLLAGGGGPKTGIARAVLLAPMLGIAAPPFGPAITGLVARAMVALGRGGQWVLGGSAFLQGPPGSARQLLLTSDAARYADEGWWVRHDPALAMGSVTWGWLAEAITACRALVARAQAMPLPVPVRVLLASNERLVSNAATQAALAGRAELVTLAGAHELLREADALRAAALSQVLDFLAQDADDSRHEHGF